jgi:hypothetical protein
MERLENGAAIGQRLFISACLPVTGIHTNRLRHRRWTEWLTQRAMTTGSYSRRHRVAASTPTSRPTPNAIPMA